MSGHHHIVTPKTYGAVLVGLMALMIATILAAQVHIGPEDQHLYNLVLALAIAFCKMSLIILFFMHVKYSSNITRVFAAAGFLWLVIFFVLLFCDYAARQYGMDTPITTNPYLVN
ncbi:MAG: cytochrome C oxidase subunit IV family protein [Candidatus Hydrogenedentes bacterium]|nr:cytochrome C oxidase subunit IV family protein [Candidatus Hydrogenedentota bacterium]